MCDLGPMPSRIRAVPAGTSSRPCPVCPGPRRGGRNTRQLQFAILSPIFWHTHGQRKSWEYNIWVLTACLLEGWQITARITPVRALTSRPFVESGLGFHPRGHSSANHSSFSKGYGYLLLPISTVTPCSLTTDFGTLRSGSSSGRTGFEN